MLLIPLPLVQSISLWSERSRVLEAARGPVEVIVTESQASLADDQLKKKRGIRRARARACLLRSFGFLPGEPGDSAQSPRNLIAGPGTRAGRAEELEEPEEQEELWWRPPARPHPVSTF